MTQNRAAGELLFAALIWGFGFIAAIYTFQTWGPFWSTTFRFVIALIFTIFVAFILRLRSAGKKSPQLKFELRKLLRLSFFPGILVGATILLQTWGLSFTTATKSSFITALYVTVVPFFEWVFFKRGIRFNELAGVGLAIVGVLLMNDVSMNGIIWNVGDLLTVFCAICAAAQIVWIGRIQTKIENAFEFNGAQCFWALIICTIAAVFKEPLAWPAPTLLSVLGLLSLAVGSTAVAFALQIRAQRVLSATTASLFFLLEAPFATLFAYYLLHERLSVSQALGGILILLASGLTLIIPRRSVDRKAVFANADSGLEKKPKN